MRHFAVQRAAIQLAAIDRFEFGQNLRVAHHQVGDPQQDRLPLGGRLAAPAPVVERPARALHRRIDVGSGRHLRLTNLRPARRIETGEPFTSLPPDPFPVDKETLGRTQIGGGEGR